MPIVRKKERAQVNNLTVYLQELEKEEKIKPKVSRKKEIRLEQKEIKETKKKKHAVKSNKTKNLFFKR